MIQGTVVVDFINDNYILWIFVCYDVCLMIFVFFLNQIGILRMICRFGSQAAIAIVMDVDATLGKKKVAEQMGFSWSTLTF
ncbi:hypothetical protein HanPSC8_Chr13g0583711 [Helianthus annuus]|nr:hypothetical protein HanPSC8_Chr13g0583711 [Helianthus annuus]